MIQAVIVAGGRGERMRPATDSLPKPMLDIAGKPLLEHQLEWLRDSGFRDVAMCLGYKADVISQHFGTGARWGLQLHYQVEAKARGTAGAVLDLSNWIKGDLLIIYGDLYVALNWGRLFDFHAGHAAAATLVVRSTDHPMDSDLVKTDGNEIKSIYRARPGEVFENKACAAVWVIRPQLLQLVPKETPSDFARDVFPKALREGKTLMAYTTQELVLDLGTPARIEAFLKQWQARR